MSNESPRRGDVALIGREADDNAARTAMTVAACVGNFAPRPSQSHIMH